MFLSQLSDGRHAACKQINTEGLSEDELRAIMREITLIRGLHHEHIVGYLGLEHSKQRHRLSIFMEYAMGGSVSKLLKDSGALSEAQTSRYLEQVLRGLAYLHCHGIAHRDIKGANILLSSPKSREEDLRSSLSPGGPSLEEVGSPSAVVHVAKLADPGAGRVALRRPFNSTSEWGGASYQLEAHLERRRKNEERRDHLCTSLQQSFETPDGGAGNGERGSLATEGKTGKRERGTHPGCVLPRRTSARASASRTRWARARPSSAASRGRRGGWPPRSSRARSQAPSTAGSSRTSGPGPRRLEGASM